MGFEISWHSPDPTTTLQPGGIVEITIGYTNIGDTAQTISEVVISPTWCFDDIRTKKLDTTQKVDPGESIPLPAINYKLPSSLAGRQGFRIGVISSEKASAESPDDEVMTTDWDDTVERWKVARTDRSEHQAIVCLAGDDLNYPLLNQLLKDYGYSPDLVTDHRELTDKFKEYGASLSLVVGVVVPGDRTDEEANLVSSALTHSGFAGHNQGSSEGLYQKNIGGILIRHRAIDTANWMSHAPDHCEITDSNRLELERNLGNRLFLLRTVTKKGWLPWAEDIAEDIIPTPAEVIKSWTNDIIKAVLAFGAGKVEERYRILSWAAEQANKKEEANNDEGSQEATSATEDGNITRDSVPIIEKADKLRELGEDRLAKDGYKIAIKIAEANDGAPTFRRAAYGLRKLGEDCLAKDTYRKAIRTAEVADDIEVPGEIAVELIRGDPSSLFFEPPSMRDDELDRLAKDAYTKAIRNAVTADDIEILRDVANRITGIDHGNIGTQITRKNYNDEELDRLAKEGYKKVIKMAESTNQSHTLTSSADKLREFGEDQAAKDAYKKAIRIAESTDDTTRLSRAADGLQELGEDRSAKDAYKKVISAADSDDAHTIRNAADDLQELGEDQAAKNAYRKAIRIAESTDDATRLRFAADGLRKLGEDRLAKDAYKKTIEVGEATDESFTLIMAADGLRELGKDRAAKDVYKEAIKIAESTGQSHRLTSSADRLRELGEDQAAKDAYKKAIRIAESTGSPSTVKKAADGLRELGENQAAKDAYRKTIRIAESTDDATRLRFAADGLRELGEDRAAKDAYKKAINATDSTKSITLTNFADVLRRLGNVRSAKVGYKQAIMNLDDSDSIILYRCAKGYKKLSEEQLLFGGAEKRQAIHLYKQAAKATEDAEILELVAHDLQDLGKGRLAQRYKRKSKRM